MKSHFNYYAVASGTVAGIYLTFDLTKENTDHVSGNIFKGFDTIDEAIEFMVEHGHEKKKISVFDEKNNNIKLSAFDHGKYEQDKKESGSDEDDDETLRLKVANKTKVKKSSCVKCDSDDDNCMIQCKSCQKWLHYRCTLLPPYTLSHYATTSARYKCDQCQEVIGPISEYFEDLDNRLSCMWDDGRRKSEDTGAVKETQTDSSINTDTRETQTDPTHDKSTVSQVESLMERMVKNINSERERLLQDRDNAEIKTLQTQ